MKSIAHVCHRVFKYTPAQARYTPLISLALDFMVKNYFIALQRTNVKSRNTQNYRKNSKPANMTPLCAFDGQSSAEPRQTKINDGKANCKYAKLT